MKMDQSSCILCKASLEKNKSEMYVMLGSDNDKYFICLNCHGKIFEEQRRALVYGYSMGYHVSDNSEKDSPVVLKRIPPLEP